MRGQRTYYPWGHVSGADRAARQRRAKEDAAYFHILNSGEIAKEILAELVELGKTRYTGPKPTKGQDIRINELMSALNVLGIDDETIFTALGE